MPSLRTWAYHWGSTAQERARAYPAQQLLPGADLVLHRAVDVAAAPDAAWRWLCQLKVAPYSYDWLDNSGRRSPRTLTPGAEVLVVGERFMSIFDVAGFETGRSITLRLRRGRWMTVTYAVEPVNDGSSRIVLVVAARNRHRLLGEALVWGDALMMRKQLLTLADLAASSPL